jgi:hypothetical protein
VVILQAYKFELRTEPRHLRHFARTSGCCRYVYNKMLAHQQANHAMPRDYANP